jgi:thiopurine S-methyltransferase
LLITLDYEQSKANGPPFSVSANEVSGYWDKLRIVFEHNAIDSTPPKFKEAGLTEVNEKVWLNY